MFDDLVLLAKGGLTVWHGSVKKVEEYFGRLGFHVPERVNSPDHYIDILEGMVKPSTSSSGNTKDLPTTATHTPGYAAQRRQPFLILTWWKSESWRIVSSGRCRAVLAGELWQDVKYNVELKKDHLHHNLLNSKDLSNRLPLGVLLQYKYFLGRVGKQRLREARRSWII